MPINQSSSRSSSFQSAIRPRRMSRSASRPPPSYAQVLAEKYGMLSTLPSTSSGGFSDYQDSTDAEQEEENNNSEVPIYQISTDTNEAIFMQRCINLVHRSNKCILKTFFKRTKLLGWDEFTKNHCIITDIKQSCVLRHVLKSKWKIGNYYFKEKNLYQTSNTCSEVDIDDDESTSDVINLRELEPNKTYLIPGSFETITCSVCSGQGTYSCTCCLGETKITCTKCVGGFILLTEDSEIKCFECDGTGLVGCPNCYGKGFFKCTKCRQLGEVNQYKKLKVSMVKQVETEYECFDRVFPRSLLDASHGDKYSRKVRSDTLDEMRTRENDERVLVKARRSLEIIPICKINCLTAEDRRYSYTFWLVGRKPYLFYIDE